MGSDDRDDDEAAAVTAVAGAESSELGSMASVLRQLAGGPGDDHAALHKGVVIDGAYRVERAIGEGGMGVVYLARDVRLARDVAIKVGTAVSSAALARAGREALALARLSHPNVVVVYQVGELGGRLYIAMELVPGGNARQWQAARPRRWREIVALYAAAGDGLAAAHAAGLVHRDFKPDNVLVGDDGRPRVADFGLARESGVDEPASESSLSPTGAVTQTGAVVGTPAYMAPEQLAGGDVDARADQFAFCAALWEALFGTRPFTGRTPAELRAQIAQGGPASPPADRTRGVPRGVIAALERGLRRDRDARWPAMAPLLAALRHDDRARRRRVAAVAGAAATIAIAVGSTLALRGGADPCTDGPARLAPVWNPARAAQLIGVFERAGAPASGRMARDRLDAYARQWTLAHRDACVATRVDGSQSEAILDRRMLCLARARAQLDAIVAILEPGRRDVVEHAPDTLALLPDLAPCADAATLANQAALPADPVVRARVVETDRLLTRLATAELAVPGATSRSAADATVAGARAIGWPPLVARALMTRAMLLAKAVDTGANDALEEAAREAIAAGDDAAAGSAMARLAWELANRERGAEAGHWIELAKVEWRRLGKPAALEVRILSADAERQRALGDPAAALVATEAWMAADRRADPDDPVEEAERLSRHCLALHDAGRMPDAEREGEAAMRQAAASLGDNHPKVARYAASLASVYGDAGELERAVELSRRAVAIDEAWYGPDDVRLAHALEGLGVALDYHGDAAEARTVLERALAIATRAGMDPGRLGRIESDLGNALDDTGDEAGARQHYERAEELLRKAGASPLLIAKIEMNLGILDEHTGHAAAALARLQGALATMEAAEGHDNPDLIDTLYLVGSISREVGALDDSERVLRRAVALLDHAFGPDNPRGVDTRNQLARTLTALHRARDAVEVLAPAIAAVDRGHDVDPAVAAETRFAYADALWAADDHARARAEAQAARDGYAALPHDRARVDQSLAQVDAWLRAHH